MTSARKSRLAVFAICAVGAGIAAYYLARPDNKMTAVDQPPSDKVVIEEQTMKQLKSLGYTN
jgi:hypothetical protein